MPDTHSRIGCAMSRLTTDARTRLFKVQYCLAAEAKLLIPTTCRAVHENVADTASLSIAPEHIQSISRAAPLSKAQRADVSALAEDSKATWGYNKTVARAIRQKRRSMW